uniref:Uncharacterized protein n=1 Tax=Saccharum officinarum TaxID=4547 RepID=A0A678TL19_SACOF|nr:hypothetical protein SO145G11_000011 [Saccharum officinarum]
MDGGGGEGDEATMGDGGDEVGAGDVSNPATVRRPAAPSPGTVMDPLSIANCLFTNSTSGRNLGPSTHESDNVAVAESEQQEELRDSEQHPLETVQGIEHQEPSHEQDVEAYRVAHRNQLKKPWKLKDDCQRKHTQKKTFA